jgi:MFS family permease
MILASVVFLDRIGKGIRTAPRDALISLSSAPQRLGLAFGIHRAFDTAGALLGPIVAFGLLALLHDAYDVIFVTSFFLALIGLAALLLLVRNPPETAPRATTAPVTIAAVAALLQGSRYRGLAVVGTALGLVTVADSFIYLGLRERLAFDVAVFPLLYVGTATTYLALAVPAGRIADRVGRGRVFLFGHVMLLLACASLLIPGGGLATALLCLGMLGAYYACTDGVLMALASAFLPSELRASGLALLATATGLARLFSSVMFGAVWNWWGIELALGVFIVGLIAAMLLALPTLFRVEESSQHGIVVSG